MSGKRRAKKETGADVHDPGLVKPFFNGTSINADRDKLLESEEKFRAIFDRAGVGIVISNSMDCIQDCNVAFQELLGYSKEDLLQKSFSYVTYPDDMDKNLDLFRQMVAGEIDKYQIEKRYIRKDGRAVWCNLTVSAIREHDRALKYLIALIEDITERKRAEAALRGSEEKFRLVADFTYDWESWVGPEGNYIYVSPSCERITGHGADEFYRDPGLLIKLIHPDDRAEYVRHKNAHINSTTVGCGIDFRIVMASGETRWVSHLCQPVFGSNGEWLGRRASNREITDRKRAEDAQRDSELTKMVLMDGIFECMFLMDRNGIILDTNSVMAKRLGKCKEELIGAYAYDLIDQGTAGFRKRKIDEVFSSGRPARFEDARSGTYFENIVTPVFSEDGKVEKVAIIAIDITGRKRTEAALRDAKARAELYLDLMSHDINNMHQIALGYIELARDIQADWGGGDFLDTPMEVLQRSARLIQNVRKLQKLQDGMFQTESVDVCKVLVDVQREFGAVPYKTVRLNLNSFEHSLVLANELLYDVFANLISNAIKHTGDSADIIVDLNVVNDNGICYWRVLVDDNGPGIPDDFKVNVFNRMLKGTDNGKGMGLGLFLVRSLVDSFGGRVWVEDRVPGDYMKGARFVVMLPAVME